MSKIGKFCPQFHLSLQSGCDKTLKNMNRLYDTKLYTDMMNRLRELFNKPVFTTDIIVGFPGESEEDFLSSVAFVQSCGFEKVHCFSFSPRQGTTAFNMDGQLTNEVKQSRNKVMSYKCQQTRQKIDFEDTALLEQKTPEGYFTAYTTRYIPVLVPDKGFASGDIVKVKLTGIEDSRMKCEVVL